MAMMIATGMSAMAQDKVETTVAADVVSSYIWRGQDLGSAAIQPTLGVAYKGLSLTAWGSYGLVNTADAKEFDLTLSYTIGGFNISVADYWTDNAGGDPQGRYFKYDAHSTNHVFEANIGYDFGLASVQWFTNFAGNDGTNKDGKRAYSSYAEVTNTYNLETEGTGGFAVTNLSLKASKEIKVTDSFSIPVFGEVVANPGTQKAYMVFGITLQP